MKNILKTTLLLFIISTLFGCKKDSSENEDNVIVESYPQTSFCLIEQSIGSVNSIERLSNNEYLVLGEGVESEIFHNVQLTKINTDCNTVWTKSYGGNDNDFGKQIHKTDDGLILIGSTRNMAIGSVDMLVIKTDFEGNEIWSKNYGAEYNDHSEAIIELENGNFIILGHSADNNLSTRRMILMIDQEGTEVWSKENEFIFNGQWWSIIESNNDQLIVLGTSLNQDNQTNELEVEKMDIDGNSLWVKHYESIDRFTSINSKIIKSKEGGYMIISTQASGLNNNDSDILLIKIDEDGNKEWSEVYGGSDSDKGRSIIQTNDNQYVILGNTSSFGNGSNDLIVLKIDQSGEQIWAKTFGGVKYESGNDLIEIENGDILICGAVQGDSGNSDFDLILLKLDSNGNPI